MSDAHKIRRSVLELIRDFERYPDKYLTESDVRCALVKKLMAAPEFRELEDTEDGSKSIPVHTEVRWYGQSNELKWRSDIVIIDVSTLRVKDGILKLPSKGFGFNRPRAILEIKLRRINGVSNNEFITKIGQDIERLENIRREVEGDYSCDLIILDKKADITEFVPFNHSSIRVYYCFTREGEGTTVRGLGRIWCQTQN